MTTAELTATLDDQRLARFLPMIAEVWEDGDLTDLEIAAVCMALIRDPGIDLTCKEALRGWLDPEQPPTAADLAILRGYLEYRASTNRSG